MGRQTMTNEVTDIETVKINSESLMRVLAGMSGDVSYLFVAMPPYETEQEVIEMFNSQQDVIGNPIIDPERLIDRSGHEPRLVEETTMVHISNGNITYHEVDVKVVHEDSHIPHFTGERG